MARKAAHRLTTALERMLRGGVGGRRLHGTHDTERFLVDLYAGVLGREPDAQGFADHVNRLGLFPRFKDAQEVLATFVNSEEARRRRDRELRSWLPAGDPDSAGEPVRAVLSLGTHCLTSMTLRIFGLKRFSGPFDWIFSNPQMVAHCIEDDFRTFLDRNQYERIPPEKRITPDANLCDHRFYRDQYDVRMMFNHRDVTKPEHQAYYRRCVDRFRDAIRADHRTLLVMITECHMMGEEDFKRLCAALAPFDRAELMVVRVARRAGRFGGELLAEHDRHKLHELHLTGKFGTIGFTEPGDSVMFRHMLDAYRFDLLPSTS